MGLNRDKLRMEAISRLQGELANEGRTQLPPSTVTEKASAGAGTVSKRSGSKKRTIIIYYIAFQCSLSHLI
jgi:hypothetical protein